MKNRRSYNRIHSYAKAVFLFYDLIGYVRDVSENGLRIEILEEELPSLADTAHTTIISHPDLDLAPFNILAEVCWTRKNGPTIGIGLKVVRFSSPNGREIFSRLVEVFKEANGR